MGTVTFQLEAEEAKAINAFLRVVDAQKKTEAGMQGITNRAKETDRAVEKIGKTSQDVTRAVGSIMGAFAGASAIVGALDKIHERLLKIRELRQAGGEAAAGVQGQMVKLAQQMGWGGDAGLNKAMKLAQDVASAGGLDLATGASIAQGTYGNIKADSKTQLRIARLLAGTAGKGGLTADEAGALAELVEAAGAGKTEAGATRFLAEAEQALLASASLGFGQFSTSSIKGGMGLLLKGATPAQMFTRMTQARAVSGGSDDVAAETLKIVTTLLDREAGAGVLKFAGAEKLPVNQQLEAIGNVFARAQAGDKEATQALAAIPADRRARAAAFFSDPARRAAATAEQMIGQADAGKFAASLTEHRATLRAQTQAMDNQFLAQQATAAIHNKEAFLAERKALREQAASPLITRMNTSEVAKMGIVGSMPLVGGLVEREMQEADLQNIQAAGTGAALPGRSGLSGLLMQGGQIGMGRQYSGWAGGTVVNNIHHGDVYAAPVNRAAGVHPSAPALP